MRTSILGAAFLLAGAGAAGLAAAANDTNGSGLALNGSDTLFDVTRAVITSCNGVTSDNTGGDTYLGGGSGVGSAQEGGGGTPIAQQAVSPMSRALKNSEFCGLPTVAYPGTACTSNSDCVAPYICSSSKCSLPESQGATESLLVGIDGVAIAANQTNSCSSSSANGFGAASMTLSTGTYTFGDNTASIYKNQPSFDALAVLYFGLTHDGTYNCQSEARKTLIASWKNLFSTDCSAGDGTCSAGLTHAWRRSDLSGTTDAFVSVLNPAGRGIGTLANVPVGAAQKVNPFCNSADANTGVASYGGSSDFSDKDPLRTVCGSANAVEDVCESYKFGRTNGLNVGDLGVVLPVLLPDATTTVTADPYPTAACSAQNLCTLVAPIKLNNIDPNYLCPGSNLPPNLGFCLMPAIDATSNDPRCISNYQNHCFDVIGKPDGRQYNLPVIVNNSQFTGSYKLVKATGTSYQFAVDVASRPQSASFYRIHSHTPGLHNVVTTGTNGVCQENDDTSQIGCLVDSDPCSVGFAGREDAKAYPGAISEPLKALSINGTPPFTPDAVAIAATGGFSTGAADPDLGLQNLLAAPGSLPLYPLARRLYFNTLYGFNNLVGGEAELAQCYGTDSILTSAVTGHGFVAVPGGVQCIDYPEKQGGTAPAPNVQGVGNAALGGCGASTNTDACSVNPPHDIHGNVVPEATETF